MSSGATHDKVTIFLAPIIFIGAWWFLGYLAVILALAFLFSGLMFNGDLDINSQVYNRWFLLKWMWLPYRNFGHRSVWTHGPIVGTLIRLLWVLVPTSLIMYFCGVLPLMGPFIMQYKYEIALLCGGLEVGSISHTFMDWASTGFKKLFGT